MKEKKPLAAGLLLFFLAPVVAELLSSSSPPVKFFTPLGLIVMTCLYGSGAIIARELTIKWRKGWPTLLALGAAYGILEEGIMVRSFFDTAWPGLGPLAQYGRAAGVNWVWVVELTIFHSLISIAIPNLLADVVFPDARGRRLTGRVGLPLFCIVLAVDVVLGGLGMSRYAPPLMPFLLAFAAAAGFVLLARFLPALPPPAVAGRGETATLPLFILGLAATLLFFILSWVIPALPARSVPPVVTALLMIELTAGLLFGLRQIAHVYPLNDLHQWALASGALAFFILLSERTDVQGMAIVGLGMAVFLLLVRVLIRRRKSSA